MSVPLSRDFIGECFKELAVANNLKILNTCKEWREFFFACHENENVSTITLGKQYQMNARDTPNICCGSLDPTWTFAEINKMTESSKMNHYCGEFLTVAKFLDGLIWLCVNIDYCSHYILVDSKTLSTLPETRIVIKSDQVKYYRICCSEDNLFIQESTTSYLFKFILFPDCVLLIDHINVSCTEDKMRKRLEMLKDICPGDSVDIDEDGKQMVKSVVPSKKDIEKLPLWYLPQYYRVGNSIVLTTDEGEGFRNVSLDRILTVTKSSKITAYILGKEVIQVGFYIVLYVPDFPIGKVKKTLEKYYVLIINGIRYFLSYNGPQFKIFENKKNAEIWRKNRMSSIKQLSPLLQPGDLIMKGYVNKMNHAGKQVQSFNILKKIAASVKTQDEESIDMEEIDNYLFLNNIDEELQLEEDEKKTDITSTINSKRYYINEKDYVYQEHIQDILIVSEADLITLKGCTEPIFKNDTIVCKISGKNRNGEVRVDRIVYGGVVLNGVYYQADKVTVKNRIIPEVEYDMNCDSDEERKIMLNEQPTSKKEKKIKPIKTSKEVATNIESASKKRKKRETQVVNHQVITEYYMPTWISKKKK